MEGPGRQGGVDRIDTSVELRWRHLIALRLFFPLPVLGNRGRVMGALAALLLVLTGPSSNSQVRPMGGGIPTIPPGTGNVASQ